MWQHTVSLVEVGGGRAGGCIYNVLYVCCTLIPFPMHIFLLLGIIVHSDKCYWWKLFQYKVSIPPNSSSLNKQKHLRMETALVHYVGCGPVWTVAVPCVCGLLGHLLVLILKRRLVICQTPKLRFYLVFVWKSANIKWVWVTQLEHTECTRNFATARVVMSYFSLAKPLSQIFIS